MPEANRASSFCIPAWGIKVKAMRMKSNEEISGVDHRITLGLMGETTHRTTRTTQNYTVRWGCVKFDTVTMRFLKPNPVSFRMLGSGMESAGWNGSYGEL